MSAFIKTTTVDINVVFKRACYHDDVREYMTVRLNDILFTSDKNKLLPSCGCGQDFNFDRFEIEEPINT